MLSGAMLDNRGSAAQLSASSSPRDESVRWRARDCSIHRTPRQSEAATIYSSGNSIGSSSSRGTRLFLSIMRAQVFQRRSASSWPGERSDNSRTALHHHAHSVSLDHRDRCLRSNEFAFGDNIDNMIGEACFSAWPQNRERGALHSGHQSERSRKFARHAGQRWARRIRGHESKSAIQTRARQKPGEKRDHNHRSGYRDEKIKQWNGEHAPGREKSLAWITIDHGPEQRGQHKKNPDYTENDGGVREKENLDQHQHDPQNKEGNNLPASEASQVMTEEKKRKTNRRDNSGQTRPWNFEFEIGADDSAQEQQRRERRDPKGELLEAARIERDDVAFKSGLLR